ncbi:MAG: hypothetical protein MK238_10615, partial [Nitrospinales bacterium]|nr:hypothetical protein [Nitrospinales bacterium]
DWKILSVLVMVGCSAGQIWVGLWLNNFHFLSFKGLTGSYLNFSRSLSFKDFLDINLLFKLYKYK